jgi:hypothetical protein
VDVLKNGRAYIFTVKKFKERSGNYDPLMLGKYIPIDRA